MLLGTRLLFTPLKGRHPCCFSWNLILGSLFISWSCYPSYPGALKGVWTSNLFRLFRRWITIESMQCRLSFTDRKSEKDAREDACRSSCSLDFEPPEWSLLFRAFPLRIERCDELIIRGIRGSVSLSRYQPNWPTSCSFCRWLKTSRLQLRSLDFISVALTKCTSLNWICQYYSVLISACSFGLWGFCYPYPLVSDPCYFNAAATSDTCYPESKMHFRVFSSTTKRSL